MGIRIVTEHNIKTKKFGLLTFSLLTSDKFSNLKKILSSKITDKEFFINFLHHLSIKPKFSQNNLMSLSDNVLIRIGKEIIKANHLNDDFAKIQEDRKLSFFTKYRKYLEKEIEVRGKRMQKYELPLEGISEKIKRLVNSPALKMIVEFQKRQDDISRFMYTDPQFKESVMAIANMNRDMFEKASAIANMNRDMIEKASVFANMHKDMIEKNND